MLNRILKRRWSGTELLAFLVFTFVGVTLVGQAVQVPFQFQAGDTARASEVNQNFEMLELEIEALQMAIATLQEKTQFVTIESGELNGLAGPHVIFSGANVHVQSGSGTTNDGGTVTGLGNLVVGYNETATNQAAGDRAGSHNLVLGLRNRYTSFAGLVAGSDNVISGEQATVTGGKFNSATGAFSHVSGGGGATNNLFNTASGDFASILGGLRNTASGDQSCVSGGSNQVASGFVSAVSGGGFNTASGAGAAVSGGAGNMATQSNASISGGNGGTASGIGSAISGGLNQTVSQNFDWRACDLTCP